VVWNGDRRTRPLGRTGPDKSRFACLSAIRLSHILADALLTGRPPCRPELQCGARRPGTQLSNTARFGEREDG